jgi:hypothetical protein
MIVARFAFHTARGLSCSRLLRHELDFLGVFTFAGALIDYLFKSSILYKIMRELAARYVTSKETNAAKDSRNPPGFS